MPQTMPRAVFALLPLAVGYFVSELFGDVNWAVAADIMRDLGVSADALGPFTSGCFLTSTSAQLPVSVLLDVYGPRRVQFALLLCAASMVQAARRRISRSCRAAPGSVRP